MEKAMQRAGYYSASIACVASVGYAVFQILQVTGIVIFPYDGIFIFGFSILIASPFAVAMLALHFNVGYEFKFWTGAGVLFAGIYAALVSSVYIVELAVSIPMTLKGAGQLVQKNSVVDQMLMAVDALGYSFMSISTLFASVAIRAEGFQRWLKRLFLMHGLLAPIIIALLYFPEFLLIGSLWMITAPASLLLLAIWFKEPRA